MKGVGTSALGIFILRYPLGFEFFETFFCCCDFCTEDERDWNEHFGFIRDFYCTSFQIFEFLLLFAYPSFQDGGIESKE